MWRHADIADAVEAGLRKRAAEDDLEQAVYGFDALAELELHPIIHDALREAGYGVIPEQRYPDDWRRSRRSEGRRCDVVLTPDGQSLLDPEVGGTLFADAAGFAVGPESAYWLEVKTVAQHETSGAFTRYSAELLNPVYKDVSKLWHDGVIRHAGLLIVLFTQTLELAEHDLQAWYRHGERRGVPVQPPVMRSLRITDRIGNAWCTAAVCGVRG